MFKSSPQKMLLIVFTCIFFLFIFKLKTNPTMLTKVGFALFTVGFVIAIMNYMRSIPGNRK